MTCLTSFLNVQGKIHSQLDDVIDSNCQPRLQDKGSLPYLETTTMEISRHSSRVYATRPHRVFSDTTLGRYDVPENSQVIFDFMVVHQDPKHWKDLDTFDLTQFLDDDGNFVYTVTFGSIPFSGGPRGCIGQLSAKIQISSF